MNSILVPAHGRGERLDIFLASEWPETSRSQIAKKIKAGQVLVNGKSASVHQFLKQGDEIRLLAAAEIPAVSDTKKVSTSPANPFLPKLDILKETKDWIVLNKPIGIVVHPDRQHEHGTLVDLLLAHSPTIAKVGEDPSRPGIVHRLDKEVGGLMVIAKTQEGFEHLKKQFAQHSVDKRYRALVYGEIPEEEGDLKFRIDRSRTKARMAAKPVQSEGGKAAWTHYTVVQRFHNATLLELTILSGRTHQIRAHLFAFNHPVIGDPLYTRRGLPRSIKAPHTLLQSTHLGFIDPATETLVEFDLPVSETFTSIQEQLSPQRET